MSKVRLAVISVLLAFILAGCQTDVALTPVSSAPVKTVDLTPSASRSAVDEVVTAVSDSAKRYVSLAELKADSDIVIRGTVVQTTYFFDATVYTKSLVKVDDVYAGNVKVGDQLVFVERGGTITRGEMIRKRGGVPGGDKLTAAELQQNMEFVVDGAHTMLKGDTRILFATYMNNKTDIGEPYYWITGNSAQGKFVVKEGELVNDVDANVGAADRLNNGNPVKFTELQSL